MDKEQCWSTLINEVEALRKTNDQLQRNLNRLQKKYKRLVEAQEAEDCYTCVCGMVTQCNCKHMGYLKPKLIDLDKLNNMWVGSEEGII